MFKPNTINQDTCLHVASLFCEKADDDRVCYTYHNSENWNRYCTNINCLIYNSETWKRECPTEAPPNSCRWRIESIAHTTVMFCLFNNCMSYDVDYEV